MVEIFVGQIFFLVFYLIGCDFCHLPNILSLLMDEVSCIRYAKICQLDHTTFLEFLSHVMATFFDLHLKV